MQRLARHWNVTSRPRLCRAYAARPPRLRPGAPLKEDMQVQPDQPIETHIGTEKVRSEEPQNEQQGQLESLSEQLPSGPAMTEFPNLMQFDPLMDSRDVLEFPPDKANPYGARVVSRNDSDSIFKLEGHARGIDYEDPINAPEVTDAKEEELSSAANVPIGQDEMGKLFRFPIFTRRITQQTGKGKIHRMYSMYIVGNGDGLVGLGEAKDDDVPRAQAKAFAQAVRNMDYVERFEDRTIWTDMETKLGATQILMRPRPVGFGLRCNPNIHQVLKAAGIKDISAKVWGSRNKINVIKATFRMLQGGNAPLGMGDGIGGVGRKLSKGSGAVGMGEVERQRGRKLIPLRR